MNIKIDILNAEEVGRSLLRKSKEVKDATQQVVTKVALNVERFGKTYSPVDTGLMRSTIYPVNIRSLEAWVGPKTFYAKFVHARIPFMSAAREDTLPTVGDIIKQEIKKAIS